MNNELVINIAIVDDDKETINTLKIICVDYFDKIKQKYKLYLFSSSEVFMSKNVTFDIAFLDIEMPKYNGIELANKIRTTNKKCFICFITNYVEYSIDAYGIHAFDYVLKPINQIKIHKLLNDILIYWNATLPNEEFINIKTVNGLEKIFLKEIMYLEYKDRWGSSVSRITILYTKDSEYIIKEKISTM